MKRLDLQFKEFDLEKYKKATAFISDVTTIIKEDTIIYVNDEPVVLYASLKDVNTSAVRWAVKNQKYPKSKRTRGLQQQANVFGYYPRNPITADYCRLSEMAKKYPKQHYVLTNFIKEIEQFYKTYFPETYEKHANLVKEKVLEDYQIENTPFTSGIVNKNNRLNYHFDAGNFKGVLSNMIVFKKGVSGGHLCIPSLDIALEVADNTLTIFNGQDILHGVSEIHYDDPEGYRYSVVYYSLEQLWKCEEIDEELIRIRNIKTEREKKMLDVEHLEELKRRGMELEKLSKKEINKFKESRVNE
jgi:hypothetical protein